MVNCYSYEKRLRQKSRKERRFAFAGWLEYLQGIYGVSMGVVFSALFGDRLDLGEQLRIGKETSFR